MLSAPSAAPESSSRWRWRSWLAALPGAGEVVEVTGVLDGGLGQCGVAPLVGDANKRAVVGLIEVAVTSLHEAPIADNHVLQAARCERRAAVLLFLRQLLAEPRHRPIEMMQIKPRDADDGVILAPAIRGAVGAAHEQPVQHGEEHGAFQRKAVLALARQRRDHRPAAGLLPQPLEHQRRPDAADPDLMDTTSLYFEGAGGQTLGEHGYSKDHRPDLRQMILAVLLDGDGRPVCSEMWPGNTADVTTLIPVIDRLRRRFAIARVCVVADRGMISAETVAELEARRLLYILGVRERSDKLVRELVLEDAAPFVPLAINKRGKQTDYEAKTVMLAGRRYIVCRNHQEAEKDTADRASIVAALERQLAKGDKALVGNTGYRRYLKTISDQHFAIDPDKIAEDNKFDGIFVLRTNTDLNPLAAMLCYKQLWTVEQTSAPPSTCSRQGRSSTSSTRPSAATCSAASSHWC